MSHKAPALGIKGITITCLQPQPNTEAIQEIIKIFAKTPRLRLAMDATCVRHSTQEAAMPMTSFILAIADYSTGNMDFIQIKEPRISTQETIMEGVRTHMVMTMTATSHDMWMDSTINDFIVKRQAHHNAIRVPTNRGNDNVQNIYRRLLRYATNDLLEEAYEGLNKLVAAFICLTSTESQCAIYP
jgi:hypothetical protein